jgi:AraC-like DNA-binding protein
MQAQLYLWRKRTLYLGPMQGPLRLKLAAARLLVSLDDSPLVLRVGHSRQQHPCQSAVLPVGARAELLSGHRAVADCHLDVKGFDWALLAAQATHRGDGMALDLVMPEDLAGTLRQWLREPADGGARFTALDTLLNPPALTDTVAHRIDERIDATIQRIQQSVSENVPLSTLAQEAGLSNSRLVNLFKGQVGIPVRRYRLWHRLFRASCLLAGGASATEAAHEAGFSDAAHLSHTYRDILGITPTELFGPRARLHVHVEAMADMANHTA